MSENLNIKAKKKFGQNFLKDETIKTQIIQAIPKNATRIVEIGPGLGDLTRRLLGLEIRLECFEIDGDLIAILEREFGEQIKTGKLAINHCDALLEWEKIGGSDYFLVANLPYYAATNMILRALDDKKCQGFIVMVQREVALKFGAKCGQRDFSALAVLAALKGELEILFDVPPEAFDPQPKVISAVMRLIKSKYESAELDYESFKDFLRAAFAQPRKTLIKNLSKIVDSAWLKAEFELLGLSPNLRPHELSVALYLNLFKKANYGKYREFYAK